MALGLSVPLSVLIPQWMLSPPHLGIWGLCRNPEFEDTFCHGQREGPEPYSQLTEVTEIPGARAGKGAFCLGSHLLL